MVGRNRVIRQEAPPTIQASRTIKQPEEPSGGTSVSPPAAAASEEPDPEVTYAVADHGGGRFESRQPDVFDSEPSSAEPPKTASGTPAVLPDAREKLRDKVRKMNEEKLEIEGTEK